MALSKKGYIGWLLPEDDRNILLELFPPKYDRVIAHHCTLQFGVSSDTPLPVEDAATVVGIADDNNGVQALVLSIGNTTNRWDGGTYHITWSLAEGRKPVESNKVVKNFLTLDDPIVINLIPKFFPMGT